MGRSTQYSIEPSSLAQLERQNWCSSSSVITEPPQEKGNRQFHFHQQYSKPRQSRRVLVLRDVKQKCAFEPVNEVEC